MRLKIKRRLSDKPPVHISMSVPEVDNQLPNQRPKSIATLRDERASNHKNFFSEFSADTAPVWPMYLKEAKGFDDGLVKMWDNDLDSLLIFAGLFSAILTAFLIEVRKGLQQDPQTTTNLLLQTILSEMRNLAPPNPPPPVPQSFIVWVNGLWFIALTFSMISAIGAVLAKGWVAQYSSASSGTNGRDARDRQRRYNNVTRWHVPTVISSIPIFLHVAFFLFFAGLVILLFSDDTRIAYTVTTLVLVTTAVYLSSALIPLLFTHCPFKTPVSNLVSHLLPLSMGLIQILLHYGTSLLHNIISCLNVWHTTAHVDGHSLSDTGNIVLNSSVEVFKNSEHQDMEVLRVEALAWLITASADRHTIESTVKALAGMPLGPLLQNTLRQSGADLVLSQGLSNAIRRLPGVGVSINEELAGAYLYALQHLIQPLDGELWMSDALATLVQEHGPLYRWDDLWPGLRLIAYSVKMMITLQRGDEKSNENLQLQDKETDLMFQAGLHPHNWHALVTVVVLSFKNGGKWELDHAIMLLYGLSRHCGRITWWDSGGEPYSEMWSMLIKAGVAKMVVTALKSTTTRTQQLVGRTLSELAKHEKIHVELWKAELSQQLVTMLTTRDKSSQSIAIETLQKLMKYDDLRAAIPKAKFWQELLAILASGDGSFVNCVTWEAFLKYEDMRTALYKAEFIRELGSMLKSKDIACRRAGIAASLEIMKYNDLRIAISKTEFAYKFLAILQSKDLGHTAIRALPDILKYNAMRVSLLNAKFPYVLLNILKSRDYGTRYYLLQALPEILKYDDIRTALVIEGFTDKVITMLKSESFIYKGIAIQVSPEIMKHDDMHVPHLKGEFTNKLITMFESEDLEHGSTALSIFPQIVKHNDIRQAILKTTFASKLFNLLKSRYVWSGVEALPGILKYNDLRIEMINSELPNKLLTIVKNEGSCLTWSTIQAFSVLIQFIKYDDMRAVLLKADFTSQLIILLTSKDINCRAAVGPAFPKIIKHDDMRAALLKVKIASHLLSMLRSKDPDCIQTALQTCQKIMDYNDLHTALHSASTAVPLITQLVDMIKGTHTGIQSNAATLLIQLATHDWQAEIIKENIVSILLPHDIRGDSSSWAAKAKGISALVMQGIGWGDEVIGNIFNLLGRLPHEECTVASQALLKILKYDDGNPRLSKELMHKILILLGQEDEYKYIAIQALLKIIKHDGMRTAFFKKTFTRELLAKLKSELSRSYIIEALPEILGYDDMRTALHKVDFTGKLIIALKCEDSDYRRMAVETLPKFMKFDNMHTVILNAEFVNTIVTMFQSEDLQDRQTAVRAISETVEYVDMRAALLNKDFLSTLLVVLKSRDNSIRYEILETLSEIQKYEDVSTALTTEEFTSELLMMLKSEDPDQKAFAMEALPGIMKFDNIQIASLKAEFTGELAVMLESTDLVSRMPVIEALSRILPYDNIRAALPKAELINVIFTVLKSDDSLYLHTALLALSEILKYDDMCTSLLITDLTSMVLAMLTSRDPSQKDLINMRLPGILENDVIRTSLLEGELASKLLDLLDSKDFYHQTAYTLPKIMKHDDICAAFLEADFTSKLLVMLKSEVYLCRRKALELLPKIMKLNAISAALLRVEFTSMILAMLKSQDLIERQTAVNALSEILKYAITFANFSKPNIISTQSGKDTCKASKNDALWLLSSLGLHDSECTDLIDKGLVAYLVHILKDDDLETRDSAGHILAVFAKHSGVRALLPLTDIIVDVLARIPLANSWPHYYGASALLCELLLHDDTRPVVLKLESTRRVFRLLGGPDCVEAACDAVKHLDMLGVLDELDEEEQPLQLP